MSNPATENFTMGAIAGALVSSTLVLTITGHVLYNLNRSEFQREAVKEGAAEFYINKSGDRAFRWTTTPTKDGY